MSAWLRREEILKTLKDSKETVKGIDLSKKFGVSRQVIVQDIALLRAKGENILATPRGYMIPSIQMEDKIRAELVCNHDGYNEIEDELTTIVDLGGKVVDVIVEHPLYGEIRSPLEISSRLDVRAFIENIKETGAEPLSSLTGGIHTHTIEVDSEEKLEIIKNHLKEKNYLIKED